MIDLTSTMDIKSEYADGKEREWVMAAMKPKADKELIKENIYPFDKATDNVSRWNKINVQIRDKLIKFEKMPTWLKTTFDHETNNPTVDPVSGIKSQAKAREYTWHMGEYYRQCPKTQN